MPGALKAYDAWTRKPLSWNSGAALPVAGASDLERRSAYSATLAKPLYLKM